MMIRLGFVVFGLSLAALAADPPRAQWIDSGVIDAGGTHEPYLFQVRAGGRRLDARQRFDKAQSEETLRRLKEQGVEVFHTHLYKGFGMAAEKPEMEETRQVAELAHRMGLKVDTYIQWNSLMYETFFAEEPRAKDWIQRDASGKPILLPYGYQQSFRYRPCFSNPEYLAYLKRVVRYAVVEVKTDFIHFDNFDLNPEPDSCHCGYCVRAFRKRLESKYSPEVRRERFGFDQFDFVQPPLWNAGNRPEGMVAISDPMIQEWIDFRCQEMADALREVAEYAKRINPEVVIEVNPHGITGANRAFEAGLDHSRFLKYTQAFWSEEENPPGYLEDGRLISKIRSYKLARAYDNILFTYTAGDDVAMAEGLAFNQTIGWAGESPLDAGTLKYISFYRKNRELFAGSKDVAPVAVLRSYPSITYHNVQTQHSAILVEQALIQAHVPFALIFDEHLTDLSKYRAVVLPDSECLSDAQLASLHRYTEQGGGLLAIGHAGFYDEWRRRRVQPGLADMVPLPHLAGFGQRRNGAASAEPLTPVRKEFGKGRIAYIPEARFDGALPQQEDFGKIGNSFWKRPVNWEDIVDAVRWVSADTLGVKIGGPESMVSNVVSLKGREVLHLVNYAAKTGPISEPVPVELQVPAGKAVRSVRLLSPDEPGDRVLPVEKSSEATARFVVPPFAVYCVVVVDY